MSLITIKDEHEFNTYEKSDKVSVLHFMEDWAPQCEHMNEVLIELMKQVDLKNVAFAKIHAEGVPEVSQKYQIVAVPTFLICKDGKVLERIEGANAGELSTKVKMQAAKASLLCNIPKPKGNLTDKLKLLINSSKCMLFMKGTPENPKCEECRRIVDIFQKHNSDFGYFDVLTDEEVAEGLTTYANWSSFPQVYVEGNFIGGADVIKQLDDANHLANTIPEKKTLEQRLSSLVNRKDVMVFMKGIPSQPRCGFSRQIVEILNATGLPYDTFDILTDEEVRQGLKSYSNWPTYPQVYVKGQLIGGLDIIKELQADGSLLDALQNS